MQYSFRQFHLFNLLNGYDAQDLPLDIYMSRYFKSHRALGSKDRAYIASTAYDLLRWKGLYDQYLSCPSWQKRFQLSQTENRHMLIQKSTTPFAAVGFPEKLFDLLVASHGKEKAEQLCLISNEEAPTTIRVNLLKTTREALLAKWKSLYEVSPTLYSSEGINFRKKINFFTLEEFKQGLFEVQDEGSQLLASLVACQPGDQVLDYCGGSGGKTLAFAHRLNGTGQIYIHDIREHALQQARKRLKRAGIQNGQTIISTSSHLKKLKGKMNWVLVDVPCSGSGTLRRNPDIKDGWNLETLPELLGKQRLIFERALSFMHPAGRIVYGTCSILQEENQKQLEHFLEKYPLEVEGDIFQTLPTSGKMDGFFGVVLKKK